MAERAVVPDVTLVDAVDHLLNRGAVLLGDLTLSIAGIDLVYVGLQVLISSVETMRQHGVWHDNNADSVALPPMAGASPRPSAPSGAGDLGSGASGPAASGEYRVSLDPPAADRGAPPAEDRPERGLARLVLALVDLLRQLVERQALRRMEGEELSEAEVERMGRSLMELAKTMTTLRAAFGLEEQDLSIDLGPLGKLI